MPFYGALHLASTKVLKSIQSECRHYINDPIAVSAFRYDIRLQEVEAELARRGEG